MKGACTAGYYCELLSVSASSLWAGSTSEFCMNSNTSKCVIGAKVATDKECPIGDYCEKGSAKPKPCPVGTYGSAKKLTQASDCTDCPIGSYCMSAGLTAAPTTANQCEQGYYCETKNNDMF